MQVTQLRSAASLPLLALLLLFSLLQYGRTFDPGCSFMNGQCVYSVKLGHEGQCDAQTPAATTASTSCCRAVEDDVALMKASMALMTKQIAQLQNTNGGQSTSPLGDLSVEQLQKALSDKEEQLRNVTRDASYEISRLHNELDACRKRPDCTKSTPSNTATVATTSTTATSTTTTTVSPGL
ncbi:uncharacterized protein [Haliotis cracherodii]|uniref:uncharacterized protein n=1 Tax=Haliotis cracherodii TaxID=6455 RepID=UPI0039E73DA4